MIVYVDNFDQSFRSVNKNRSEGTSDTEAVQMQIFWLKDFCVETWMKWILKNKIKLFLKDFFKLVFLNISKQAFGEWPCFHNLGREVRRVL